MVIFINLLQGPREKKAVWDPLGGLGTREHQDSQVLKGTPVTKGSLEIQVNVFKKVLQEHFVLQETVS